MRGRPRPKWGSLRLLPSGPDRVGEAPARANLSSNHIGQKLAGRKNGAIGFAADVAASGGDIWAHMKGGTAYNKPALRAPDIRSGAT